MIEELKLLLPLLEQVTGGALWIAVIVAAQGYFVGLLWFATAITVMLTVRSTLIRLWANDDLYVRIRDKHKLGYGGLTSIHMSHVEQLLDEKGIL